MTLDITIPLVLRYARLNKRIALDTSRASLHLELGNRCGHGEWTLDRYLILTSVLYFLVLYPREADFRMTIVPNPRLLYLGTRLSRDVHRVLRRCAGDHSECDNEIFISWQPIDTVVQVMPPKSTHHLQHAFDRVCNSGAAPIMLTVKIVSGIRAVGLAPRSLTQRYKRLQNIYLALFINQLSAHDGN